MFLSWKGDHPPRHVHVYLSGRLVVKWDLDKRLVALLQALDCEVALAVRARPA